MPDKKPPQSIVEEAGLPDNFLPIDAPPIIPGNLPSGGGPPAFSGRDPYGSGLLPQNLGLQPDLVNTSYGGSIPATRLFPLPPSGTPGVNAAIGSTITKVIEQGTSNSGGSVVTFETNGMVNADQTVLNLKNGSNITMVSDNAGGVTISATTAGNSVDVNGSPIAGTAANLNNTTPAATGSATNVHFQADSNTPTTNVSAYLPLMIGDSGSGGVAGAVPAPTPGSGVVVDYLDATGHWSQPPGTGGVANYQTVQSNGVSKPTEAKLNFLTPFIATDNPGNTSTDISIKPSYKIETFNTTIASISNSTAETTLMSYTLPANELGASQALMHMSRGQFSNTVGSTVAYILRFYIDSTVVIGGSSLSIINGGQGQWDLDGSTMVVTTGGGGTVEVQGKFCMSLISSTSGALLSVSETNTATIAFDTTATHVFKVTVQMGTSSVFAVASQRQMLDARVSS